MNPRNFFAGLKRRNPRFQALLSVPDCVWLAVLSRDAVIRVYDEACNVIETHQHAGEFKEV